MVCDLCAVQSDVNVLPEKSPVVVTFGCIVIRCQTTVDYTQDQTWASVHTEKCLSKRVTSCAWVLSPLPISCFNSIFQGMFLYSHVRVCVCYAQPLSKLQYPCMSEDASQRHKSHSYRIFFKTDNFATSCYSDPEIMQDSKQNNKHCISKYIKRPSD